MLQQKKDHYHRAGFRACSLTRYHCTPQGRARATMPPAAAGNADAHVTSLQAQVSRAFDSCMRWPRALAAYIGVRLLSASAVAESPTTPQAATEAVASEPSAGAVSSEWTAAS